MAPYLWYGLIFASSCKSVNGKDVERQIQSRFEGDSQNRMMAIWKRMWWLPVKGWHATEFGILYALFRKAGFDKASAVAMVAVGAALDEYHQTKVEGRTGTPRDVMIDIGGALAAVGIEEMIERKR